MPSPITAVDKDILDSAATPSRALTLEQKTPITERDLVDSAARLGTASQAQDLRSYENLDRAKAGGKDAYRKGLEINDNPTTVLSPAGRWLGLDFESSREPTSQADIEKGTSGPDLDLREAQKLADKYKNSRFSEKLEDVYDRFTKQEVPEPNPAVVKPWMETLAKYVKHPIYEKYKFLNEASQGKKPELISDAVSAFKDYAGDNYAGDKDVRKLLDAGAATEPIFPGLFDLASRALWTGLGNPYDVGLGTIAAAGERIQGSMLPKGSAAAKYHDTLADQFQATNPRGGVKDVVELVREHGTEPATPQYLDDLTSTISKLNFNQIDSIGDKLNPPDLNVYMSLAEKDHSLVGDGPLKPIYQKMHDGNYVQAQKLADNLQLGAWPLEIRAQVFGKTSEPEFLDSVEKNARNAVKATEATGSAAATAFQHILGAATTPTKSLDVDPATGHAKFYKSNLANLMSATMIPKDIFFEANPKYIPSIIADNLARSETVGKFAPKSVVNALSEIGELSLPITPRGIEMLEASRLAQPLMRYFGFVSDPRFSADTDYLSRVMADAASTYNPTISHVLLKSHVTEPGSLGDLAAGIVDLGADVLPYEDAMLALPAAGVKAALRYRGGMRSAIMAGTEHAVGKAAALSHDPWTAGAQEAVNAAKSTVKMGTSPLELMGSKAIRAMAELARVLGFNPDDILNKVRTQVSINSDRMHNLDDVLPGGSADIRGERAQPGYAAWKSALAKSIENESDDVKPLLSGLAERLDDGEFNTAPTAQNPVVNKALADLVSTNDLVSLVNTPTAVRAIIDEDIPVYSPARVKAYLEGAQPGDAVTREVGDKLRDAMSDVWLRAYGHDIAAIAPEVRDNLDNWLRPDFEYNARTPDPEFHGEGVQRQAPTEADTKLESMEKEFGHLLYDESGKRRESVDPMQLFYALVGHVAANRARKNIGLPTARVGIRSLVPESRRAAVQEQAVAAVADRLGTTAKGVAKLLEDGADKTTNTIKFSEQHAASLRGLVHELEPYRLSNTLPPEMFKADYNFGEVPEKDWESLVGTLQDFYAGAASGRHAHEYSAGYGVAKAALSGLAQEAIAQGGIIGKTVKGIQDEFFAQLPQGKGATRAIGDAIAKATKLINDLERQDSTFQTQLVRSLGTAGEDVTVKRIVSDLIGTIEPVIDVERVANIRDGISIRSLEEVGPMWRACPNPNPQELKALEFITRENQSGRLKMIQETAKTIDDHIARLQAAGQEVGQDLLNAKTVIDDYIKPLQQALGVVSEGAHSRWFAISSTTQNIAKRLAGGEPIIFDDAGKIAQLYEHFFAGDIGGAVADVFAHGEKTGVADLGNRFLSAIMYVQAEKIIGDMCKELTAHGLDISVDGLYSRFEFGNLPDSKGAFGHDVALAMTAELHGAIGAKYASANPDAYRAALEIMSTHGFKPNRGSWVVRTMPDGSRALMPPEMNAFLNGLGSRAGPLSPNTSIARGDNLGNMGLAGFEKVGPGSAGAAAAKGASRESVANLGEAVRTLTDLNIFSMAMVKQLGTIGYLVPPAAYYVNQVFWGTMQNWMARGPMGVLSPLREPAMASHIAGRLFGREEIVRRAPDPIINIKTLEVMFHDTLYREAVEAGLRTSFVKANISNSLARDIVRNVNATDLARILRTPETARDFYSEVATGIDNYYRVALYIEERKSGMSPVEAAEMARKAQFDYGEMSDFAKHHLRDVFLYYSAMHQQMSLWWDTFMTHPSRVLGQLRLAHGMQEMTLDKRGNLTDVIPNWAQGKVALMCINNQETAATGRQYCYALPNFPTIDTVNLVEGLLAGPAAPFDQNAADKFSEQILSRVTPLHLTGGNATSKITSALVVLAELHAGKDPFTGMDMGEDQIPTWLMDFDTDHGNGQLHDVFLAEREIANSTSKMDTQDSYMYWKATGDGEKVLWFLLHGTALSRPVRDITQIDRSLEDYGPAEPRLGMTYLDEKAANLLPVEPLPSNVGRAEELEMRGKFFDNSAAAKEIEQEQQEKIR